MIQGNYSCIIPIIEINHVLFKKVYGRSSEQHMNKQEIEINIYCYSEKEEVGISYGTLSQTEEIIFNDEDDFDICTMQESFWENYYEFVPGIEKAKVLLQNNNKLSLQESLFEIFGHFKVIVQVNDKEVELDIPFIDEIESCMYSMLEAVCD